MAVLLAAALAAAPETIDRIAVSVGNAVITQSEIERAIRITAFLNAAPVNLGVEARKKAAEGLVEQKLIRREMQLGRYPAAAEAGVDPMLRRIRARYPDTAAWRAALAKYEISEGDLREQLLWQLTLLRFIDVRFRPGIQVTDQQVQEYYDKQIVPVEKVALEDVRDRIEQVLTSQQVDRDLDQWLRGARQRTGVMYREDAFR